MAVLFFKSLWGMPRGLESQLERIAAAGYDGIECAGIPEGPAIFAHLLKKYKLKHITMLFTKGETVDGHIVSFKEQLPALAASNPVQITAHTSRDKFSFDDQVRFYQAALEAEARCPVPVNHESHRSRAMFAPWITADLLRRFPKLHLCADFSHWVCVCESLLDDQKKEMALAISRSRHIHTRVGYEEGPQVTDPAASEFKRHLERHLQWWDAIVKQRQKSRATITITPEFGPPGYQHTVPYTQQPLTDLWEICLWMMKLLRKRYKA